MDNELYCPMKMTSNPLGGGSWTTAAPSGGLQGI